MTKLLEHYSNYTYKFKLHAVINLQVDKTVWDWDLLNDSKPIWTRKPSEVEDAEYNEFYKALTKDSKDALTKVHFVAEGEVTFKALLYVPAMQPTEDRKSVV